MNVETLYKHIKQLGVEDFIGVPDSTLKSLSDYLNIHVPNTHHFVPVNEGAAVALASGFYLSSGCASCVYMQNSGIGNAINPIASLINEKVYDIPMLFIVGYRGEPGIKDEPQHKFQGEITLPLLQTLNIPSFLLQEDTTEEEVSAVFADIKRQLSNHKQFALVVKKGALSYEEKFHYENGFTLGREQVIRAILQQMNDDDIIVSTTGKISRELYEQCDQLFGQHNKAFLTVGSMGHALMIAVGIAKKEPNRTVYCIDGDGAALMHMGSMAFTANQQCDNLIHITLNNMAHESVGGMPTNCKDLSFADIAKSCGYPYTSVIHDEKELQEGLENSKQQKGSQYLEIQVSLQSRSDLGRPKETPIQNKENFMKFIKGEK